MKKISEAQQKVMEDYLRQKKEGAYNRKSESIWWKLRGYMAYVEYWIVAYSFFIAVGLWIITGDFWKGLGFWFVTQIYTMAANIRGVGLHIENLLEWVFDKNV